MAALARRIRFGCSLQLPPVRLGATTLERLQPGDLLRLDVGAGRLSEWRVGGQTLSLAQAMRHGAHRAARIEPPVAGGES
jgi:flagellar motor switch protein FliM